MVNAIRKNQVDCYVGLGIRVNFLNGPDSQCALKGYPRCTWAFGLAPYSRKDFKTGNLQSFPGLAYQFQKRR